jgi:hypothetical protein
MRDKHQEWRNLVDVMSSQINGRLENRLLAGAYTRPRCGLS